MSDAEKEALAGPLAALAEKEKHSLAAAAAYAAEKAAAAKGHEKPE